MTSSNNDRLNQLQLTWGADEGKIACQFEQLLNQLGEQGFSQAAIMEGFATALHEGGWSTSLVRLLEDVGIPEIRIPGAGFSVSAIAKAVTLEEIKAKALSNKERVIERLRIERQKSHQEWFDSGKADGLSDAQNLSYDDFQQLWDLHQSKDEIEKCDVWIGQARFPEHFDELLEKQMKSYSPKPIPESYLAGWLDGVIEFWDEIKDEI